MYVCPFYSISSILDILKANLSSDACLIRVIDASVAAAAVDALKSKCTCQLIVSSFGLAHRF